MEFFIIFFTMLLIVFGIYAFSQFNEYSDTKKHYEEIKSQSVGDYDGYFVVPHKTGGFYLYVVGQKTFLWFLKCPDCFMIYINSEIDPDLCGYVENYLADDLQTIENKIEEIKKRPLMYQY